MSTLESPVPPALRAPRPGLLRPPTRGAAEAALDQPAGLFLQEIPWRGRSPDPDELSAQAFLGWL
jgi:hypothetical protein